MRIAIVSDVHGNRTAFEAVLADLRQTSPDLVLHGGDLADFGANPANIVDRIRDLGWQGVIGNGEEALSTPRTLEDFAVNSSAPASLWAAIREMMTATRELLGMERIDWLRRLPRIHNHDRTVLVHASPDSAWRSPGPEASDAELRTVYEPLGRPVVVYGHIHRSFIRTVSTTQDARLIIANSGSVSLSYDGDHRAAYLLLDDAHPSIRRVDYNLDDEIKALYTSGLPHADWVAATLRSGYPQMPSPSSTA